MELKNFRVGYYSIREDVCSTFYQKESAEKLAEQLHTVAPTHKDALAPVPCAMLIQSHRFLMPLLTLTILKRAF